MNEKNHVFETSPGLNCKKMLHESLVRWKIYAKHKLERQRAVHKAVYSYNVRLKQKALTSLFRNCIEAKRCRNFCKSPPPEVYEDVERVPSFEGPKISKGTCHVRRSYSSNQNRRKALDSNISNLRNEIFLRKYINYWKEKCSEKMWNTELEKKANEFYRDTIRRKFLRLWLEAINVRLLEKRKWQIAIVHFERKLLKKIWSAWIDYCNDKIEKSNKLQEIRGFYENKLRARSFRRLFMNALSKILKKRKLEKATNYYNDVLSRRVIRAWLDHKRMKKEYEKKVDLQRRKMENSSKRNALKQWQLYVWRKKCCRRKNNVSRNFYNRRLARKTIFSLKKYLLYRKKKAIRLFDLKHSKNQLSLDIIRANVEKWRIAVFRAAQDRQKVQRSLEHWRFRRLGIYFSVWKSFSERYKLKAERKKSLHNIGRTVLLNKYMNLWLEKHEAIAIIRAEENQAASHYVKKILSLLFRSWKKYVDEKAVRKVEIEAALELHRKLLLREGLKETLKICLYKIESRYESRLRCVRNNSTEDFDTMKKFFVRWLSWVYSKGNVRSRDSVSPLKKEQQQIYEITKDSTSTRFVFPEYMLKTMKMPNYDNHHFHKENNREEFIKT